MKNPTKLSHIHPRFITGYVIVTTPVDEPYRLVVYTKGDTDEHIGHPAGRLTVAHAEDSDSETCTRFGYRWEDKGSFQQGGKIEAVRDSRCLYDTLTRLGEVAGQLRRVVSEIDLEPDEIEEHGVVGAVKHELKRRRLRTMEAECAIDRARSMLRLMDAAPNNYAQVYADLKRAAQVVAGELDTAVKRLGDAVYGYD